MALVKEGLRDVLRDLAAGKEEWPLFLHGAAGIGKSMAALALADFVAFSWYSTHEQLCDELMAANRNSLAYDWDSVGWADLAIMDEIGAREKVNDLHYTSLLGFWERRERRNQRTIYISNCSPEEIKKIFDDRIYSRLMFGTVIELEDIDRRTGKKS